MLIGTALTFLLGLTLLTMGADWLVRGACNLADHFKVSPLVVGLTVVAFGTSAPELVVSASAAMQGRPGLVIGNVMGSTVANVGLIVGIGALLRPITVHRTLLVRETPLLLFVLLIVILLTLNGSVGRLDGLALVTGFVLYLGFLIRWGRSANRVGDGVHAPMPPRVAALASDSPGGEFLNTIPDQPAQPAAPPTRLWHHWLRVVLGSFGLYFGADLLIESSVQIAETFGVPEPVIGATLVALGTSLPELASTTAAALRGLGDIALGNVIGSNVFNLGLALGVAATLRPLHVETGEMIGQVVPAIIFCFVLIPLAFTRNRVGRVEGLILLTGYAGYIAWMLSNGTL